jgi:hypothetical protein
MRVSMPPGTGKRLFMSYDSNVVLDRKFNGAIKCRSNAEINRYLAELEAEQTDIAEVKANRAQIQALESWLQARDIRRDPRPPFAAEWLLKLLTPRQQVDALLGDLQERYNLDLRERGRKQAMWLYWASAFNSIGPLVIRYCERWGVFMALASVVRRIFSAS